MSGTVPVKFSYCQLVLTKFGEELSTTSVFFLSPSAITGSFRSSACGALFSASLYCRLNDNELPFCESTCMSSLLISLSVSSGRAMSSVSCGELLFASSHCLSEFALRINMFSLFCHKLTSSSS